MENRTSFHFSEFFIRRPMMTIFMMLAMFFMGAIVYRLLPMSDLPEADLPAVQLTLSLAGANPETISRSVTSPIEKQLASISGIHAMHSISRFGQAEINLQFSKSQSQSQAMQAVQAAIASASSLLPAEAIATLQIHNVNIAAAPVFYLALTSDKLPLVLLHQLAEKEIAAAISQLPGVGNVTILGAQKYALHVQLDPNKLFNNGLGIEDVVNAIQHNNIDLPTGSLTGHQQSYLLHVNGQLADLAAYQSLPITYNNNKLLRLQDIAKVTEGVQQAQSVSWLNGQRAIVLAITRQPDVNTLALISQIRNTLPALQLHLPQHVKLSVVYDRAESMRSSIHNTQRTLSMAAGLVIFILILFIESLTGSLIAALGLAVTIVGSFGFLYWKGENLTNLSLLVLMLGLVYVVDDVLIIIDQLIRRQENDEKPAETVLKTLRHSTSSILFTSAIAASFFIPLLYLSGIAGTWLHGIATITLTIIALSCITTLIFIPVLTSRTSHREWGTDPLRWQQWIGAGCRQLTIWYSHCLQWLLKYSYLCVAVLALVWLSACIMLFAITKQLLPQEDTGQLIGYSQIQNNSVKNTQILQQKLAQIIQQDSNVESVVSSLGVSGLNNGQFFIRLKQRKARMLNADQVKTILQQKLAHVTGASVILQNPLRVTNDHFAMLPYQLSVTGDSLPALISWGNQLASRIRHIQGVNTVRIDSPAVAAQVEVQLLRDKMTALGITAEQIEKMLGYAYGSKTITTMLTPDDRYDVMLGLPNLYQNNPALLSQLYLRTSGGAFIPLKAVTTFTLANGYTTIPHYNQIPGLTISFALKPEASLADTINAIETVKRDMRIPASISVHLQGIAEGLSSSKWEYVTLLCGLLLVIYVALVFFFDNFYQPLTVFSGIGTTFAGACLLLMSCGFPLNIYSSIGIVLLVIINMRHLLLTIDTALNIQRRKHITSHEAIYQACMIRFRPQMITMAVTLAAILPAIIAMSGSSEVTRPFGLAVLGGTLFSMTSIFLLVPAMYTVMESLPLLLARQPVVAEADEEPISV